MFATFFMNLDCLESQSIADIFYESHDYLNIFSLDGILFISYLILFTSILRFQPNKCYLSAVKAWRSEWE